MKLKIMSDVHLEFSPFITDDAGVDVVILAGDIHVGEKGVVWAKETFKSAEVLYILGNHEYYGQSYPKHIHKMKEAAKGSNVDILENNTVELNGVAFHGCTLWTDFALFGDPRVGGYACQQAMTDFKKIRKEPTYSKIRSLDIAQIHAESLRWLEHSLQNNRCSKNVVITHHGPSMRSVPDHYKQDIVTAGYVSDLEKFVFKLAPSLWIHGHLHNSSDYYIDETRVVCNPRGYPLERQEGFKESFIVEI